MEVSDLNNSVLSVTYRVPNMHLLSSTSPSLLQRLTPQTCPATALSPATSVPQFILGVLE